MADTPPLWLIRLRTALFAADALPAAEETFRHEDATYVCQRRLDDDGQRLVFHETWLDPRTYQVQKAWSQEIQAASFAGELPEPVFQQMVARLVEWLTQARPVSPTRTRPPTFDPQRFARQGRAR